MFLVTRAPHASRNTVLRDAGDGKSKKITDEGVLFLKAPNDADVVVRELTEAEADGHRARMTAAERESALSGLRASVAAARANLEAANVAAKAAVDLVASRDREVQAAEKALADADAALTGATTEKPTGKPSKFGRKD